MWLVYSRNISKFESSFLFVLGRLTRSVGKRRESGVMRKKSGVMQKEEEAESLCTANNWPCLVFCLGRTMIIGGNDQLVRR